MTCVKEFRLKKGYTRAQMADKLKISISLYDKIEFGVRESSRNFLNRFKKAFPEFDMNIFFTSDNRAGDDTDD